jgi:hypothetical protein
MTDRDALSVALDDWQTSLFRLEALDRYQAAGEEHLLAAYLRGDRVRPFDQGLEDWLQRRREEYATGRRRTRVHAIGGPLTPYLAFEIEWAYTACAEAGEDIRILHRDAWAQTPFGSRPSDFYILDDRTVVVMAYDDAARWVGGELITAPEQVARFRALRDQALAAAVALDEYLATPPALVAPDLRTAALRNMA